MNNNEKPLSLIVERKYRVISKIGEGTFGKIFKGLNINNNTLVAIKIEKSSSTNLLIHEAKIYKNLEDTKGIPKMLSFGKEGKFNYLVLNLFDESLEDMKDACGDKLSLKSVIQIALQTIERLSIIHKNGIIHRDIKPDNFVVDRKTNEVYLIDFGLAKRYLDEEDNHIPSVNNKKLTGTARYASINNHKGMCPSRRDDLESLGFVLLYLLQGKLPWQGIKHSDKEIKYNMIGDEKQKNNILQQFPDVPGELITYILYCRRLEYDEDPDYDYLMNIFNNLKTLHGYENDNIYDWNVEFQ
jgi:casein kinase I family protein HRR25